MKKELNKPFSPRKQLTSRQWKQAPTLLRRSTQDTQVQWPRKSVCFSLPWHWVNFCSPKIGQLSWQKAVDASHCLCCHHFRRQGFPSTALTVVFSRRREEWTALRDWGAVTFVGIWGIVPSDTTMRVLALRITWNISRLCHNGLGCTVKNRNRTM